MEMTNIIKHSSLLIYSNNYCRKKFDSTVPEAFIENFCRT